MNIDVMVESKSFIPKRAHETDAGYDVRANIDEPITIRPGQSVWADLGFAIDIPAGYFGLLSPRSGLGCKHGITFANCVGIIDAGYHGVVRAKLLNNGLRPYTVQPHERVGQLIIIECADVDFIRTDEFPESERGDNGYGSTGRD